MSAPKSSNLGMLTAFNGASLDFDIINWAVILPPSYTWHARTTAVYAFSDAELNIIMNAQFFHLRTWVFKKKNTLGFLQVEGLAILETTLSILADEMSATVHPNPVPPAMPFVSTTRTWLNKVIWSLMGRKLLLLASKHSSWWIQIHLTVASI